jgi:hypothetical protein
MPRVQSDTMRLPSRLDTACGDVISVLNSVEGDRTPTLRGESSVP